MNKNWTEKVAIGLLSLQIGYLLATAADHRYWGWKMFNRIGAPTFQLTDLSGSEIRLSSWMVVPHYGLSVRQLFGIASHICQKLPPGRSGVRLSIGTISDRSGNTKPYEFIQPKCNRLNGIQ